MIESRSRDTHEKPIETIEIKIKFRALDFILMSTKQGSTAQDKTRKGQNNSRAGQDRTGQS